MKWKNLNSNGYEFEIYLKSVDEFNSMLRNPLWITCTVLLSVSIINHTQLFNQSIPLAMKTIMHIHNWQPVNILVYHLVADVVIPCEIWFQTELYLEMTLFVTTSNAKTVLFFRNFYFKWESPLCEFLCRKKKTQMEQRHRKPNKQLTIQ